MLLPHLGQGTSKMFNSSPNSFGVCLGSSDIFCFLYAALIFKDNFNRAV